MPDNPYAPPQADLERLGTTGVSILEGELDVGRLLDATITVVRENLGVIAGVGFIYGVPLFIVGFASQLVLVPMQMAADSGELATWLPLVAVLVQQMLNMFVQLYLNLGVHRYILELVRGEQPTLTLVVEGYRWLLPGLGAYVLWFLGYFFGLILLVIPGIIWMVGTQLHKFRIVEGSGAIDALRDTWELSRGYKLLILLWGMVGGLVLGFFGIVTCGLGFLLFPAIWIGYAYIYEHARAHRGVIA